MLTTQRASTTPGRAPTLAGLIAPCVEPQLLRHPLRKAHLAPTPRSMWAELPRRWRAERPPSFGHGTTVEVAAWARRWALRDPCFWG